MKQKQIIGYVGSTGLSTGPHLGCRLSKNRRVRNPLKEAFPAGYPIYKKDREGFIEKRDEILAWLTHDGPYPKRLDETPIGILDKNN